MEFTFNDCVRYSYTFFNPNHAAALLAILLGPVWMFRLHTVNAVMKSIWFSGEMLLYVLLFYTYSRAGLSAAIMSGIVIFIGSQLLFREKLTKACFRYNLAGLTVGLAAFFYSGINRRLFGGFIGSDNSIDNRFAVWLGGLNMVFDMPGGVGTGFSGRVYSLFYLSPASRLNYRTLVSSFLTFLTEQGVVISMLLLLPALAAAAGGVLLLLNSEVRPFDKKVILTCLGVIVSGTVSGIFSTCFDISLSLDGINNLSQYLLLFCWLSAFAIIILLEAVYCKLLRPSGIFLPVAAALLMLLLTGYFVKCLLPHKSCQLNVAQPGLIELNRSKNSEKTVVVTDLSNWDFKRFIHSVISTFDDFNLVFILSEKVALEKLLTAENYERIILCGQKCRFLRYFAPLSKEIILIAPVTAPGADICKVSSVIKVYLDKSDSLGINYYWKNCPAADLEAGFFR
ncbi:hypothetical protein P0136_11045 [Lentisphaerota bacterium ZTH]|nr:hypothetical protein JYG24_11435 [Lentisphaerota bacterium]WET05896.1 hypothetical protein P0136_11045 [Lentisphaerota bacterium ZTH]